MVRELAGHDPDRMRLVIKWPIREALLSFVEKLKKQARRDYEFQYLLYAICAPYSKDAKPPEMPEILK